MSLVMLLCWLVVIALRSCDSFCSKAEPCYASLLTSRLQLWRAVAHSYKAEPFYACLFDLVVRALKSCGSFCSSWALIASLLTSWLQLLGAVAHSVQAEPFYASLLTSRLQLWRAVTHSVQAEPCYASLLTLGYRLWLILFKLSLFMLLVDLEVTTLNNGGSFKFKLSFASLLTSWFHFWTAPIHCVQPELCSVYLLTLWLELYPWIILSKLSSCLASLLMSQCLKVIWLLV